MCYMGGLEMVGVRELRQNLSVYLERIKRGETLMVTEHNQVVATLQPASATANPVDRLIEEGRATAPKRRERPAPLVTRVKRPLSRVLNDLRGDKV